MVTTEDHKELCLLVVRCPTLRHIRKDLGLLSNLEDIHITFCEKLVEFQSKGCEKQDWVAFMSQPY